MTSNESKAKILGMPAGTASARLRKNILFHLLRKHNENICVRCNKIIEKVDDLSIEHIKPWESEKSADLFWDLNNIAFSHYKCNMAERHSRADEIGKRRRKIGPEGTSWCFACEKFKPISDFSLCSTVWRGLNNECKSCKNARNALRDRTNYGWMSKKERLNILPEAPDGRATLS